MHMVAVGDIVAVRNARHNAKPLLQALGKLVGGGFQRGAVQRVINIFSVFPLVALIVHVLHHTQGKGLCGGIGMALAGHIFAAFIQTRIAQADGGVAAVQQLINGLALFQAGQSAVLPQNGCRIGQGTLKAVMAVLQGAVAQFQALIKNFPEFIRLTAGGQGHIRQVDGNNTLIEAAIVLRLARHIVLGVGHVVPASAGTVGGQKAAAAHAGKYIAVALGLTLRQLVFLHLLFADIIRHHTLCGAFGGQLGQVEIGGAFADIIVFQHIDQLGERGGDPDALFILNTLVALAEHFFHDNGKVRFQALVFARFVQVHEYRDERCLAVGGHQGNDLVLDGLHTALDFLAQTGFNDLGELFFTGINAQFLHLRFGIAPDLFAADIHKRCQVGQADALAAVLVGCHLRNDLGGNVAGRGERMRFFDEGTRNNRAVLQHVVQVDQVAVVHMLGVIVSIMEMNDAILMCLYNLGRQQHTHGQVLADLAGHIIALNAVDGRVFIGVFLLDFLIVALDEGQNAVVGGVMGTAQALHIAVGDIFAGHLIRFGLHDGVFHQILDLLHVHGVVAALAFLRHIVGNGRDLFLGQALVGGNNVVGFGHRCNNFGYIENGLAAVALDDLHELLSPYLNKSCRVDTPHQNRSMILASVFILPHRPGKVKPMYHNILYIIC